MTPGGKQGRHQRADRGPDEAVSLAWVPSGPELQCLQGAGLPGTAQHAAATQDQPDSGMGLNHDAATAKGSSFSSATQPLCIP